MRDMGKKYTHAKGFNVTSLKGVSGLYLIRDYKGNLAYIGKCEDDFKNRINSHMYGEHGKLNWLDKDITVIIVDPNVYPLHVLEHLFIWYFLPYRNYALWFFYGNDEDRIVQTAKENNLEIQGPIKQFISSFESVVIEREWDEKYGFKRYGEYEQLSSRKKECDRTDDCLCFNCLMEKKGRRQRGIYTT